VVVRVVRGRILLCTKTGKMCYNMFMKRLLSIVFFLVFCGYCFAEEPDFDESEKAEPLKTAKNIFGLDSGILAANISYGTEKTYSLKFNANLLDFYFENIKTGLGAGFIPINYSYSVKTNEHALSLSKLYLYWNMDKVMGINISDKKGHRYFLDRCILGPFVSIQTLNFDNSGNFNTNFSYSAGIKYATKVNAVQSQSPVSFFSSNIELGYNYFNSRHSIYFTIGLSPTSTLVSILISPFAYIYLLFNGGF
jgi:hypothetical protein